MPCSSPTAPRAPGRCARGSTSRRPPACIPGPSSSSSGATAARSAPATSARAAAIAKQLEPLTGQAGRFNLCIYHHFQAWEALLRKDLMDALQKEKAALRMAVEVGCPLYEVLCRLALAGILADCGDERSCISHLADAAQHRARHRQPPPRVHLPDRLRADRARARPPAHRPRGAAARRSSSGASTATSTSWAGSPRRWRACWRRRSKPASSPTTRKA